MDQKTTSNNYFKIKFLSIISILFNRYGFDWVGMLSEFGFVTPPVSCFRHAPLSDKWTTDVCVGMKVLTAICLPYLLVHHLIIHVFLFRWKLKTRILPLKSETRNTIG